MRPALWATTAVLLFGTANVASAYVGASFVQIPGADGGWNGAPYQRWFKVDGNYWPAPLGVLGGSNRSLQAMRRASVFSGANGPRQGAGTLVLAIDKDNPALPQFMHRCLHKTPIPELRYAEASERSRTTFEIGARPDTIPEYFEYQLEDVLLSDCPVVADAPQQAIVISFKDIQRLNYDRKEDIVEAKLDASTIVPAPAGPKTRSFVLTWFALAHDISADQCPVMNAKPGEADYYALVPKDEADRERAQLASKGGVNYENGQMGQRGPHKLNVTMAPGIIRDPGNAEPRTSLARGLDLDGDPGAGAAPAGICRHPNYSASDGRTGIDNQLYRTQGCIQSYQGHKGFYMQFSNNQMHDGSLSMLVQVTGIDNLENDNQVEVKLIYSLDPMVKSAAGSQVLPDYTFRITGDPRYTHYFTTLRGRIVNRVVTTEPVKELRMNLGQYGTPANLRIFNAGLRFELAADGTMKGVLGGYQDWRSIVSRLTSSAAEQVHNFQVPGMYNALKRNADGLKDPQTGQCNGISSAYDMEGIPAYIEPAGPAGKADRQVAKASAGAVSPPPGTEPASTGGPATFRRLDEAQYRRAVEDVFGSGIKIPGRFEPPMRDEGLLAIGDGKVVVSPSGFEQFELRAREIATQVLAEDRRKALLNCAPVASGSFDRACASEFFGKVGRQLFRRPLSERELASFLATAQSSAGQSGHFHRGLEAGLARMLVSPSFLFRVETSEPMAGARGVQRLNDYSLATRISFLLWNAPPDAELLDAAAKGTLRTPRGLEQQVDRLIASPRFEHGVRAFFADMFAFDQFVGLSKDQAIYPKFTSPLLRDSEEQLLRTIVDVLLTRQGDYRELFTTKQTFMSRNLGALYKVQVPQAGYGGWTPHTFGPDEPRAGILSLAGFLMLDPTHEGRSSPTIRGKSVRELFLCQKVPLPPGNVDFKILQDTSNALYKTARQRLVAHRDSPACAGCHAITDPIGLAMENYDALGDYRTSENGAPIDASGRFEGKPYRNAIELQRLLHDSTAVTGCVVSRAFEYGVGRPATAGEREWLKYATQRFADEQYRFPALLRRIATSKAFQVVATDSVATK